MSPDESQHRGVRVEVSRLSKSFNGQAVLREVDLDVAPGEIVVIMGPSGSGKSVLLKHMIALEVPDSGEVRVEGESVHLEKTQNRYRLAMVFQSGALLSSLTVGENVGLYLAEHRVHPEREIARIVKEKLELVGLRDVESRYPSELSGGMRKRVALARALVIEPQLLLYDEPTSELDPLIAVTIADEILKLNRRTQATSIVVSHDRDLAFGVADRVGIIHEGRIVAIGPPDEVRANSHPVVRRFLTADFNRERKPS